jgi:MFS family permease
MAHRVGIPRFDASTARRNSSGYMLYSAFISIDLWMPIWVLLLLSRGISFAEIAVVDGFHRLATILLEVPTGVVADRYGHRLSLTLGSFSFAAALAVFVVAHDFKTLLVSWLLWSLAAALRSGADEAFLYESLRAGSLEREYRKHYSRAQTVALLSTAVGSLAAGFLYAKSPASPIALNTVFAGAASIALFITYQPPISQVQAGWSLGTAWRRVCHELTRPAVFPTVVVGAILLATFWAGTLFYQPYLVNTGVSVHTVGVIYVSFQIAGAIGAWLSTRLATRWGDGRVLGTCIIALWLAELPMAFLVNRWAVLGLMIIWAAYAVSQPIYSHILQRLVGPENRATLGSVRSFIGSLGLIVIRVISGTIADSDGLQNGLIAMILLILPLTIAAMCLVGRITSNVSMPFGGNLNR